MGQSGRSPCQEQEKPHQYSSRCKDTGLACFTFVLNLFLHITVVFYSIMSSVRIEYFMGLALEEASKALMEGEVPVGCVYVSPGNDEVISVGHNKTNASKNVSYCAIFSVVLVGG